MATVDYRLARRSLLLGLQTGFISRFDVCDAHPEAMRAARFIGEPADRPCPICGSDDLRLLFYAYGKELKRDSGRVRRREDLEELTRTVAEFCCYVVEVCTDCSWNHLLRSYLAGRRHTGDERAARAAR